MTPRAAWLGLVALGLLVLPWYALQDGVWGLAWVGAWSGSDAAPALLQAMRHGKPWLWPLLAAFALCWWRPLAGSALGLFWLMFQAAAIGLRGWALPGLEAAFGPLEGRQFGLGLGAVAAACGFLMILAEEWAARGAFGGDAFVAGGVLGVGLLVGLFAFLPVAKILVSALQAREGGLSFSAFAARFAQPKIWGLGCLGGGISCGVAWNTLFLAVLTATSTTVLGLAFALIVTRTGFRFKPALRLLTVLPIITPPFVIGLGLILVFGRSGVVNSLLDWAFAIPPSRWVYGLHGVWLAQTFAFTPIAFLILIGVVEGVNPSLEEAAQTLRADDDRVIRSISLPLMRPGLANAFLVGFIESIADFGNPALLGGNAGVLATEIYFAVVGAQYDQGRAATLGLILLGFALAAFWAQRRFVGRRSYVTLGGKGAGGRAVELPNWLRRLCQAVALPWAAMTAAIYAMAVLGGFVEVWGRDHSLTLRHYVKAFGVEQGPHGLVWTGSAWNSFWTTLTLAGIAAPLTAALGLLAAYLIARKNFPGRAGFEFLTLLSFAIPGTVIGVGYVLAFNLPPLELTGTGLIIVLCFVFRNMPVGVRSGIAAISQIDRSLDEASATLGASGPTTLRRVVLPLLRPALVAALIYSFVRAMTTVSAVIFLTSAEYELATAYIVLRAINGDYGVSIAYSSVLIAVMIGAVFLIRRLVGERRLGRSSTLARA
ncbi:MAG: iron ABC transporter permease [Alphaproteobacteria bacterium]|nr:iron ABC transporter permease [Alphaproteobacteria bacterium]